MADALLTEAGGRLMQENGGAIWVETRAASSVTVTFAERLRGAARPHRLRRVLQPVRTSRVTLYTEDRP